MGPIKIFGNDKVIEMHLFYVSLNSTLTDLRDSQIRRNISYLNTLKQIRIMFSQCLCIVLLPFGIAGDESFF